MFTFLFFFFLLFNNSNTLKKFLRAFWIFVTLYFFGNWGLVPPIIKTIMPTNIYRASVICQALIWEPPRCSLVSSSWQSYKWVLSGRERPSNLPKSRYLVSAGSEARPSCSKAYTQNHPPLLHALASGNLCVGLHCFAFWFCSFLALATWLCSGGCCLIVLQYVHGWEDQVCTT